MSYFCFKIIRHIQFEIMYPIVVIFVHKNPLTLFFRTWKILRENVTKPGCIIVTVPSLEEATLFNNKVRLPIGTQLWLCIIINKMSTQCCPPHCFGRICPFMKSKVWAPPVQDIVKTPFLTNGCRSNTCNLNLWTKGTKITYS